MPSIISHPAVPLALFPLVRRRPNASRMFVAAVVVSVLPDADTIGFLFGIRYGDLLGHRGLTHSLLFALTVATVAWTWLSRRDRGAVRAVSSFAFLLVAALSHGLLDACTTGGRGIAFFSPFSNARYFLPWRPILVSPIGVHAFLSARGKAVLLSEMVWVWLPALGLASLAYLATRRDSNDHTPVPPSK